MGYFMLDILLMMSVWLVVMVYLSKLATPANCHVSLVPTYYILLYICTNIFETVLYS